KAVLRFCEAMTQRALRAHPDPPENHPHQCKAKRAEKNKRRSGGGYEKREQRHIRTDSVEQPAQRDRCKHGDRERVDRMSQEREYPVPVEFVRKIYRGRSQRVPYEFAETCYKPQNGSACA